MSIEPVMTPEQRKALAAARHTHTKWGKGYVPSADPRGEKQGQNIGSRERVGPSAAKQAMRDAGRKGLPAPNGPRGMNAPIASKPAKGR